MLIPCHNEDKSIRKCVESCLVQTRKPDEIIVVDDGSTDKSPEILEGFGDKIKVIRVPKNTGNKSYAQEIGLKHITGDIFICTDADTILDKEFVERIELNFEFQNPAAVCGYVKSLKYNWLTACREIDYVITQNLHKLAQSYINFLLVIPGCAAGFKTDVFKKNISFDHDTVTEDLDFTYKLNEKDLKIKFDKKAVVYTQDPTDIRSYIRQMRRWYGGGWQNLLKHFRVMHKPAGALELTLIYVEGVASSFLFLVLPLVNIKIFGFVLLNYFLIGVGLSIFAAVKSRRIDLVFYSPLYVFTGIINAFVFIREFFFVLVFRRKKLVWFRATRRELI